MSPGRRHDRKRPFLLRFGRWSMAVSRRSLLGLLAAAAGGGLVVWWLGLFSRRPPSTHSGPRVARSGSEFEAQRRAFERAQTARAAMELPRTARVVKASLRDPPERDGRGATKGGAPYSGVFGRAVCALTGHETPAAALESLFDPQDVIGVKVGAAGDDVVMTVVEGLLGAGIPPENVTLFEHIGGLDARIADLRVLADRGVRFEYAQLNDTPLAIGSFRMRISLALERCTALINLASLNVHKQMQMSGALKNHMGSIERPESLHDTFDFSCALLNDLDPIRQKTRLVVVDAVFPSLEGFPDHPIQRYYWDAETLIVSHDAVAADVVGMELLAEGRRSMRLNDDMAFARTTLALASQLKLGISQREAIEVIEL